MQGMISPFRHWKLLRVLELYPDNLIKIRSYSGFVPSRWTCGLLEGRSGETLRSERINFGGRCMYKFSSC